MLLRKKMSKCVGFFLDIRSFNTTNTSEYYYANITDNVVFLDILAEKIWIIFEIPC